jgi:hypothetical protein
MQRWCSAACGAPAAQAQCSAMSENNAGSKRMVDSCVHWQSVAGNPARLPRANPDRLGRFSERCIHLTAI